MPIFLEKPAITGLSLKIKAESKGAFVDWQADFNTKIANAPGFVSLEFISPSDQEDGWYIVQRFISQEASKFWLEGLDYVRLIQQLKVLAVDSEIREIISDDAGGKGNITEVIVTEVSPGKEKEYRAWSARIHQVEAKFPGFRGVYIQSPERKGNHWITLLQFDKMENLDRWLRSPERKRVLEDSMPLISSLESHRVISPYAGWFASIAKTGELPPVWKQTMVVLLVLFPIVVLELQYLSPWTANLNSSLATFIGNALSVTLISFPMMPIAIYLLGWWLSTNSIAVSIAGALLLMLLYLCEVIFFW